jgi:hypothetical protein
MVCVKLGQNVAALPSRTWIVCSSSAATLVRFTQYSVTWTRDVLLLYVLAGTWNYKGSFIKINAGNAVNTDNVVDVRE